MYILDTSFFLSGMDPSSVEAECAITPEVRKEVEKGLPARKMDYYLESGLVRIIAPTEESIRRAMEEASITGDEHRLSKADISVIALALELKGKIITDDYSIQNVAKKMGIEYFPLNERGINEVWRWRYRCTGCGRFFEEYHDSCPVCGMPLKTTSSRRKANRR